LSYSLDVNILLYASDRSSPFHSRAVEFLGECTSRDEPFTLTWVTLMSYLRMVTNSAIFAKPLLPAQALDNVAELLALEHVRVVSEKEGFWDIYRRATRNVILRGKLVPDAHLASILLQHEVPILYTNDSDFRKFDFLEVRNPFG
jgi:toxin-antitoxin system PIN domain toxin